MKKNVVLLLALPLVMLAGCGGETPSSSSRIETGTDETIYHTITFHSNGGNEVAPIKVKHNTFAKEPAKPTKENYKFGGWYVDNDSFQVKYLFRSTFVTSDWDLYAKWDEVETSSVDSSVDSSSSESSTSSSEENYSATIYFADASWWNKDAASTNVRFGAIDDDTGNGRKMEHIRFCPTTYTNVGYNYWKIDIEDIREISSLSFLRMSGDGETYWGAFSTTILSGDVTTTNLFTIKDSKENYSSSVVGTWSTYDPSDIGNPDAIEPPLPPVVQEGYKIVGSGSFLNEGDPWTSASGILLESKPDTTYPDQVGIRISFAISDTWKIHDTREGGTLWAGYSDIEGDPSLLNEAYFKVGDGGNVVVTKAGTFDIYFKPSNSKIWISLVTESGVE